MLNGLGEVSVKQPKAKEQFQAWVSKDEREKNAFFWILYKLPTPLQPNLDNLYNFFSDVELQDLKMCQKN